MKILSWRRSSVLNLPSSILVALLVASLTPCSQAVTFTSIPDANLDLSKLGETALVGDYDGISLYNYEGQSENGFNTNGSQSVLARYPDGGFASLAMADAGIQSMCSFVMSDGVMSGVVVGGNFTSLGGIESPGAALFNPNTSVVTPLTGLSGQVAALLCDEDSNTVYVGGSFVGANSTNAIAWVGTAGWTNLPFQGFNGPVTSITKASTGHIIFGGSFTGLGNATVRSVQDQQIINISNATITSGSSTTTTGFSDPSNIVCKTNGTNGAGSTWLLADDTAGFWQATFGFGFLPSKLRLWNTHFDGRGTQTFRFTALPNDGILNFTYVDPDTGANASCTSECPLSNDTSIEYQDFYFVNLVGMNAFQIDISAWYGSGGGLDGIELFTNDIFAYAINAFNEPTCADVAEASTATTTGPWTISPSFASNSEYLTASLTSGSTEASVVFLPDIKQSGNYTVNMYTPGCIADGTCLTRGQVNVTGTMATATSGDDFSVQLYQTNNYDKYDQIYFGYIEAASSSFRPSVTLAPVAGQTLPNLTVVAMRVGFTLIGDSDAGINNIFEYDPTQATVDTATFDNSTFDVAGMDLPAGSGVSSLQTDGTTTYIGGNFSTSTFSNVFSITDAGNTVLSGKGLNGEVKTMFLNGTLLYVGGEFSNTNSSASTGLNNVASYDISSSTWNALGAGVNGMVTSIVPLSMNVTANTPETVVTITGDFTSIMATGSNSSISTTGFAVWVPSQNNWLQNVAVLTELISGQLTVAIDLPYNGGNLFAGSLSTSQLSANGAAGLTSSGLDALPVDIQPATTQTSGSLTKRATTTAQNVTGVVTGLFYNNGGRNVTVLGGQFTATATNGSTINSLIFINGSNSNTVTGAGSSISNDSTILAVGLLGDTLYAGGDLSGTINGNSVTGMVSYDLITASFGTQPPSLSGGNVNTIVARPDTTDIYVGGAFASAGSLSCPSVCVFSTDAMQWNRPSTTFGGTVNTMIWQTTSSLLVGGDLTVNGASTSLAVYDAKAQTWTTATGAADVPGPVSALTAANSDSSEFWVAGLATNGSTYLMKFDGSTFQSSGVTLGDGSTVRGLQIISLTKNHDSTSLVPASQTLMITGSLLVPDFGNASSALFNGTAFQPYALTSSSSNLGGSLSQIFVQNPQNFFSTAGGNLGVGFLVLIGLAIALGFIFLFVIIGVIIARIDRNRRGLGPDPTSFFNRAQGFARIPPEQLFSSLPSGRGEVEKRNTRI